MSDFSSPAKRRAFDWGGLGDVRLGRVNLGEEMPVIVYRLMQYTMLDVMSAAMGRKEAFSYFRAAGHLAGVEFANNVLDLSLEFDAFIAHLQEILLGLKIGLLRMEFSDPDTGEMILTVGEDLDCSGLPVTGENVCVYDEGLLSGIFEAYTGSKYDVNEIDCWASGDSVCRFRGMIAG